MKFILVSLACAVQVGATCWEKAGVKMEMNKHSVIIGTGGRLGSALLTACEPHHTVTALSRKELDLTRLTDIQKVLGELDYDILWLSAAITDVDFCETHPEVAVAVNTTASKEIARISAEKGAQVVFFSTDYVFDGEKGTLYEEADPTHPLSVYGTSKLNAEEQVLAASSSNLIVRLSWLFGAEKPGFPAWVIRQAMESGLVKVVDDRRASPTYTRDVVAALLPLIKGEQSWSGVLHLCNQGVCTWKEWAQHCLNCAVENGIALKTSETTSCQMSDIKSFSAQRPVYSALSTARYESLTGQTMPSWQDAVSHHVARNLVKKLKS